MPPPISNSINNNLNRVNENLNKKVIENNNDNKIADISNNNINKTTDINKPPPQNKPFQNNTSSLKTKTIPNNFVPPTKDKTIPPQTVNSNKQKIETSNNSKITSFKAS